MRGTSTKLIQEILRKKESLGERAIDRVKTTKQTRKQTKKADRNLTFYNNNTK